MATMAPPKNPSKNIVGLDMNSLTSAALSKFSAQLKTEIADLQSKQTAGTITAKEKRALKDKQAQFRAVSLTNAKIVNFAAALRNHGINLGNLKNESIYSMAEKASKVVPTGDPNHSSIEALIKKYASKTYLSGMNGARTAVVDSLKVATGVSFAVAGGLIASDLVTAVRGIELAEGTMVKGLDGQEQIAKNVGEYVDKWLGVNAPNLKGAIWTILISSAVLVAIKKYHNYQLNKSETMSEAQRAQNEADAEQIEAERSAPKTTLKDQVARAESDPAYLDTLKNVISSHTTTDINKIISDGPTAHPGSVYNAAIVLKEIEKAHKPKTKSADEIAFDNEVEQYLSGHGKNRDDLYNQIYALDPNDLSKGLLAEANRESLEDIVKNTKGKYTANQVYAARILMAVEAKEKAYGSES